MPVDVRRAAGATALHPRGFQAPRCWSRGAARWMRRPSLSRRSFGLDDIAVEADGDNLGLPIPPDAAAYVIYTSGSTGEPKGVVVTHRNVLRLFTATRAWFGFGPRDVWTLFHSVAFDFSVWEIWGALLHGGRLVVVPYAVSRDPERFLDLLSREGVTVLNQTPSAFRQLAHAEADACAGAAAGAALRRLRRRGARPDRAGAVVRAARRCQPQLVNMYGITETTVHVTYRPLTAADADPTGERDRRPIPDLHSTFSTDTSSRCRRACRGSCTSAAPAWRAAISARDRLTAAALPRRPASRRANASIAAGIARGGGSTASSNISAASTTRSSSAASASSRARSTHVLRRHPDVRDAAVVLRGQGQDAHAGCLLRGRPAASTNPTCGRICSAPCRRTWSRPPSWRSTALPLTVERQARPPRLARPGQAGPTAAGSEPRLPRTPARSAGRWRSGEACSSIRRSGSDDNVFDHGATFGAGRAGAQPAARSCLAARSRSLSCSNTRPAAGLAAELERNAAVDAERDRRHARARRAPARGRAGEAAQSIIGRAMNICSTVTDDVPMVAVVGMAGRFPQAADVAEFWRQPLRRARVLEPVHGRGVAGGGSPAKRCARTSATSRSNGVLADVELFDAAFFGMTPRDAEHHRSAAADLPGMRVGRAGACRLRSRPVSAADRRLCRLRTEQLLPRTTCCPTAPRSPRSAELRLQMGNNPAYLATRLSYKLNLTGPSLNVGTACSTSLVAIHMACDALRDHQCDIALAGGSRASSSRRSAAISTRPTASFRRTATAARSTRARRARSAATARAVVVLKRLAEALADGDAIHAVIRGTAINNDGAEKVRLHRAERARAGRGRSARRRRWRGSIRPTRSAMSRPTAPARTLGDPIEIDALTQRVPATDDAQPVLRDRLGEDQCRAPGRGAPASPASSRPSLALQHRQIPPSLHFETPNPELDLASEPVLRRRCPDGFPAPAAGRSAARRRELVRDRRHQRACGAGRSAAGRAAGAIASRGSCCCFRRGRQGARRDDAPARRPSAGEARHLRWPTSPIRCRSGGRTSPHRRDGAVPEPRGRGAALSRRARRQRVVHGVGAVAGRGRSCSCSRGRAPARRHGRATLRERAGASATPSIDCADAAAAAPRARPAISHVHPATDRPPRRQLERTDAGPSRRCSSIAYALAQLLSSCGDPSRAP